MPKRTARQIRLDTLEEIKVKDEKKAQAARSAFRSWPGGKKQKPNGKREPTGLCCKQKFMGELPDYFRPCHDCPLT